MLRFNATLPQPLYAVNSRSASLNAARSLSA
jgi:hypothetical protein